MRDTLVLPEMPHAELSASAFERWSVCPASPHLSKGLPNVTTVYAAEGTVAHHLADKLWEASKKHPDIWELHYHKGGYEVAGHHIRATDEMLEGVRFYVESLQSLAKGNALKHIHSEVNLSPWLSQIDSRLGGIADWVMINDDGQGVTVVDFKYGAGYLVEAKGNPQLKMYSLGALMWAEQRLPLRVKEVRNVIIQPRIEGQRIRQITYPASDLVFFYGEVQQALARVDAPEAKAKAVPGKHCRWCRAASVPGACPALETHNQELVSAEFDALSENVVTPERMTEALDLLPAVEARCKAIRERAYDMATQGTVLPCSDGKHYYALVPKRANRQWIDEDVAKEVFDKYENAMTEPRLKSVAQVEKALGKTAFNYVIENSEVQLVEKVPNGLKLAKTKEPYPSLCSPDDFPDVN